MTYLYIGAWNDFPITGLFPEVKHFVFTDTQPRNEFDDYCDNIGYERPNFIKQLLVAATECNFRLISKKVLKKCSDREIRNPTLYTFKSDAQTINYYVSTNFRTDDVKELNEEIYECSGLILSGYFPNQVILSYVSPSTKLFCISDSVYDYNEYDEHVVKVLHEEHYFDEMYAVLKEKKEFIRCESMIEISEIVNKYFEDTYN